MWSYRHENFIVHQIPVLSDNYIYLIEAEHSDTLIAVDPALAAPVRDACQALGKPLTHIINTHHHWDHTNGNLELKTLFDCHIIGATCDAKRIPGIDSGVSEDKPALITGLNISIIDLPGHTIGHIAYLIDDALFCGDTLFGAGCGRLFEGSASQMWHSLSRLAELDTSTKVYCAHEYTMANLAFARVIEPNSQELHARIVADEEKRKRGEPTIPSNIDMEKATNPFLRPLNREFCIPYARQHHIDADGLSVFTHIRVKKDHF